MKQGQLRKFLSKRFNLSDPLFIELTRSPDSPSRSRRRHNLQGLLHRGLKVRSGLGSDWDKTDICLFIVIAKLRDLGLSNEKINEIVSPIVKFTRSYNDRLPS